LGIINYYSNKEWSDDDNNYNFDETNCLQELLHTKIINRCVFHHDHLINAPLLSEKSLLQQEMPTINCTQSQDLNLEQTDSTNIPQNMNKTYSTMLKLICGALVRGTNYSDIYVSSDIEDNDTSKTSNNSTSTTGIDHSNDQYRKVPTLQEIARKVARLEKKQLDEKQYISYEMIACTFLLIGLVKDGHDSNITLLTSLQKSLGGNPSAEIEDIVKRLKVRGGQEQLLMLPTGPAGSGKSTASRVAEQFCYEFCVAVGVMWCDRMFLFTAYTGSASSLMGGVTNLEATCIN
jgi:hypothetical protein